MATSIAEVKRFLENEQVKYRDYSDNAVIFWFVTKNYVDRDGDKAIAIIVEISEDGEYLKIFSPMAYVVQGPHVGAFLQACMEIQWQTKLIQFEYDRNDGEIRPIIEFPIEDSSLTSRQLFRCFLGLVEIVDKYDPVLRKALAKGVVEFPVEVPPPQTVDRMLETLLAAARSGQLNPEQMALLQSLLANAGGGEEPPSEF